MDKKVAVLSAEPQPCARSKSHADLRAAFDVFFEAYAARDAERVAPFLHDDVVWTVSGPIEVLPFCGVHRGKADVLALIGRKVPAVLRVFNCVAEAIVVDGDQVAMLTQLSARRPADGRVISYRVANFFRFVDGKIIENLSLLDSFDAAEQVVGHPLTQPALAEDGSLVPAISDLVSL